MKKNYQWHRCMLYPENWVRKVYKGRRDGQFYQMLFRSKIRVKMTIRQQHACHWHEQFHRARDQKPERWYDKKRETKDSKQNLSNFAKTRSKETWAVPGEGNSISSLVPPFPWKISLFHDWISIKGLPAIVQTSCSVAIDWMFMSTLNS